MHEFLTSFFVYTLKFFRLFLSYTQDPLETVDLNLYFIFILYFLFFPEWLSCKNIC